MTTTLALIAIDLVAVVVLALGLYFRRRVGGAVRDCDAIKFIKFTN